MASSEVDKIPMKGSTGAAPMSLTHRTLLILLLVTQAAFAAAGNSLVLCLEGSSTARFELLMGECCDDEPDPCASDSLAVDPDQHEAHSEQNDCDGCEDQQLVIALVATSEHVIPDAQPTPGFWNTPDLDLWSAQDLFDSSVQSTVVAQRDDGDPTSPDRALAFVVVLC